MTEKFRIDKNGTVVFNDRKDEPQTEYDKLMAEYAALEHDVVNSIVHHTDDPVKVARYHELKKILGIPNAKDVFNQGSKILSMAPEPTEQKQSDNSDLWNNIAKFKQRNDGKK